ncbi:MAG TPA: GerMN domain-containing protein [Candidatus Kapabacteria bacterium]|nr:GerMN domain-containing protein [Candidatus Kapabacteria bacterium]
MNKKLIYSLMGLALIFFLVALIIFFNSKNGSKKKDTGILTGNNAREEMKAPEIQQVKIFFLTEDPSFIKPVTYEIERPPIYQDIYRKFVELLLKGTENAITPVPEGVTVRSLYYIEQKKMLVIDFSEELLNRFPAGSTSELEFIYFFVNNICYNFKEIKAVKFLVSGNEYGELTGHIDIGNPFYPNEMYLKASME